jgi:hypothetical protein
MRACTRVALVSMAVSASLGLAGCGAIDDLKDAMSRWFDSGNFLGGRGPADLQDATLSPAEKTPNEAAGKPSKKQAQVSKKKNKPARKRQRPQTVETPKKPPIPDSTDAVRPQGAEPQSAPSEPAPLQLRTPFPEAPASETFSR